MCSLKGPGEREGGLEKGRSGDSNAKEDTLSQAGKICFMVLSPLESHVIHGERENIKRKRLFQARLFPTCHTRCLCMDLGGIFGFLRVGIRCKEI